MRTRLSQAPDLDAMEDIAREAMDTIPEELRRHVQDVVIRLAEFPEDDVLDDLGLESPYDLLGLYQGISIDRKSISDPLPEMDMIFLYRRPILDYAEQTGTELTQVIRHVLIHEIGHHFGFSDTDMERIEEEDR